VISLDDRMGGDGIVITAQMRLEVLMAVVLVEIFVVKRAVATARQGE
jgi:hypothetical protein